MSNIEDHVNKTARLTYADLNELLAILIFIDLLFLPRLLFVFGIPVSLLIVIGSILFISSSRSIYFNYIGLFVLILLLVTMVASVTFGVVTYKNIEPVESLKRVLQLATILFYSFYFIEVNRFDAKLIIILRVFYIWIFCLMLFSYYNPSVYYNFMTKIYPEAIEYMDSNIANYRFSYFFSDPNSAAYLFCFSLTAYLFFERNIFWGVLCGTLAALTIIGTQSRGAYIALFFIFAYLLKEVIKTRKVLITVVVTLLFCSVSLLFSDEVLQVYKVFEMRSAGEEELGGGRAGKYIYFLQNLNLLPFGTGYNLLRDGIEFRPHSDLIRLNLSYGVFSLPLFLYYVYPRRRSQVLLFLVFLIPFLINTAIDDYRLLPLYLLLFGLIGQLSSSKTTQI